MKVKIFELFLLILSATGNETNEKEMPTRRIQELHLRWDMRSSVAPTLPWDVTQCRRSPRLFKTLSCHPIGDKHQTFFHSQLIGPEKRCFGKRWELVVKTESMWSLQMLVRRLRWWNSLHGRPLVMWVYLTAGSVNLMYPDLLVGTVTLWFWSSCCLKSFFSFLNNFRFLIKVSRHCEL